ncbi:MAG TPA: hypothetical protein PK689_07975 [Kiritimatiellia bacterium]|nr:hypothetical protein [Kiritimatiellia bacterium]
MACSDCVHFLPSMKASAPRPGLVGYGYCNAASTALLRARFFQESQAECWLTPSSFEKEHRP